MATLGSLSPPASPSATMRSRRWARRVERYCCTAFTYFPLLFVYGLTSWAVWVEASIGFNSTPSENIFIGKFTSFLGIFFYLMLNWSYTTAVFTDPGSPLNPNASGYSQLPTQEGGGMQYTSFTVKASTGDLRFCKKCQTKKPDRSHHCSTCKRCVLKMDHHCPWLATCVGLRNYKPFLLFLIYLSFFCWTCFLTSASWVWDVIVAGEYAESLMPVNIVLLAVLSGIIGLVITGFGAWHLWLTSQGRTTIESLEKTRYLSPLRNMRQHFADRHYLDAQANGNLSIAEQLREIHANALPGVTRPEEGESLSRSASPLPPRGNSPMSNGYSPPTYHSYEQRERQQTYDRYEDYRDERDNEQLPNAFDLGWKRNFGHVLGPSPLFWFLPICNTTGDGWSWEPSEKWLAAHRRLQEQRRAEEQLQKERERAAGWGVDSPTEEDFRTGRVPPGWQTNRFSPPTPRLPRQQEGQAPRRHGEEARYLTASSAAVNTPVAGRRSPNKADQILGRSRGMYADGDVQLRPMAKPAARKKFDQYNYISDDDDYDVSSDEERANQRKGQSSRPPPQTKDWNDIPDDILKAPPNGRAKKSRESSRDRKKDQGQEWDDWGQ